MAVVEVDQGLCQGLLGFNNSIFLPKLQIIDPEDLLKILDSSVLLPLPRHTVIEDLCTALDNPLLLPLLMHMDLADPCRCLTTFPEPLVQVVVVPVLEGESFMSLTDPQNFLLHHLLPMEDKDLCTNPVDPVDPVDINDSRLRHPLLDVVDRDNRWGLRRIKIIMGWKRHPLHIRIRGLMSG